MSDLHHLIDQHYTLDEIRLLCFELGIDYEELAGEKKSGKTAELILYCQRHGRLPALLKKLREQQPHVAWPDLVAFPEPPPVARSATAIEPPLQRPARATHSTGRETELTQLLHGL